MPDLTGLQLLLGVEAAGSLAAAGARLGMTQQAASARLRAMELRVGAPLLVRGRRGSRLTDAGRLVAQWAEPVVTAAAELDAGLATLRSRRAGTLSLAASQTVAEHLVPRWLVALQERRRSAGSPPVAVRLDTSNTEGVAAAVRAGTADVGFVEGPRAPAGLRSRVVGRDRLVVVVAPGHPWAARRRAVDPAELAATPLVQREAGSGTRSAWTAAVKAAVGSAAVAAPALELPSATAVRSAVLAGVAPGALSSLAVEDDLVRGRLVAVPVAGLAVERDLRAVWPAGPHPPAGAARDLVALAARVSA